VDSSLSEAGVLGFEIGYSWASPDGLVLWEAQFGDFVNGAQVLVDQFLVAAEQKWGQRSGLVLLLPHGWEGQGPEHSSARLERFLQAEAENNIAVKNLTTPAQLFHALRRQVRGPVRKPLVLMTPKSGLRHPDATSSIDELAHGAFQPVLGDDAVAPEGVRRVLLCSGRLWFDLAAARAASGRRDVALVRVEQLAPWPADAVEAAVARYPGADLRWVQEEPKNMGAWPTLAALWYDGPTPGGRPVRCVARPAAAAPATGSHKRHLAAQDLLIRRAFSDEDVAP
jgi:2-oxoglutarate dehydrogenase E1 component